MKKRVISIFLAFCLRVAMLPTVAFATSKTANEAIEWARSQVGHSVGYDDGSGYYQCVEFIQCDATQKATHAQFAEIFANSLPDVALPVINTIADDALPDVKMTDNFADAVYKLYRAGILVGSDAKGTFNPQTTITRAEAATIVARMAESDTRMSLF